MLRLALSLLFLTSCSSIKPKGLCLESVDGSSPCRPYRAGMISLNREIDSVKPLGARDLGGHVLVNDMLVTSPYKNQLQGISLKSKVSAWWLELDNSVTAPLTNFGQYVVAGLRGGQVLKVEASTGKVAWSSQLGRYMSRQPVLAGGSLLVSSVDQKLFSIDYATGKTNWIYDAGLPTGIVLHGASRPLVLGSQVLLGTSEGEVHAVDIATGKRVWDFNPGPSDSRFRDVVGDMASLDGNIIVSRYDGLVFSMSVATGGRGVLWQKEFPVITNTHYRDGVYYVGCINGDLLALDGSTGKQIWKVQLGEAATSITPGETIVYIGGTQGRISALDAKTGSLLWHDDVEGALSHSPVFFNDILYFGTGLKVLYGYKVL